MDLRKFLPKTLFYFLSSNKDIKKPIYLKGTTIFADISGFTQISEALQKIGREGSEILTKTLNFYFNEIISIIYKNDGDIMRFAGDAITAYFEEKEKAVKASKEIVNFFKENEIAKTPTGDFSIKIKIGIGSGVHTLIILGDEKLDYAFLGSPVDWAAEAEHQAEPGEILISQKCENLRDFEIFSFKKEKEVEIELLKKFINPVLYEKISSGFSELLNEHRKVAVMFLSFKGLESYYDEKSLKRVNDFYIKVREKVEEYEGFLNKVDFGDKGSKFLITFGAPISHEDDPDRAVILSKEIEEISRKENLKVSIGINFGVIFSGIIGNEQRCEYTVMGDNVNLAARLMQFAKEGEIILSESISKQAKAFSFEKIKEVQVKGKKEPVSIFKISSRKDEKKEEFFYGRKKELEEVLNSIKEGKNLFLISGEAGIGKTSFFNKIAENLKNYKIYYFKGQEIFKEIPYFSIKKQIKEIVEGENLNIFEILKEKELEEFAFVLYDFLDIEHNFKRVEIEENTKKAVLQKEILILVNFLKNKIICIDNFQWVDLESLKILKNLFENIEEKSNIFFIVGREIQGQFLELENSKAINLKQLSEKEIYGFLCNFLKIKEIPEKSFKNLTRIGGNPLFLKEAVLNLIEKKVIERDEKSGALIFDETKEFELPTIENLIISKLDKLPIEEQHTIKFLSVFGDTIPKGILGFLSGLNIKENVLKKLSEKKEFIFEEKEYLIFNQNIERKTIYESLDFAQRKEIHKKVADAYLKFLPEDYPERDSILSFHFIEAGAVEEGKNIIKRAGEKAYNSFAYSTSYNLFSRILKFEDGDVLFKICDCLIKLGKYDDVLNYLKYDFVLSLKEEDLKVDFFKILSETYRLIGNFNISLKYIEKAEDFSKDKGKKFNILLSKAILYCQFSQFENAIKIFDEMENLKKFIKKDDFFKALTIKAPLYVATGKREEGIKILKSAKNYFQKKGDIFTTIKILHNLGSIYGFDGKHKNSIFYFKNSKKIQEKFGIYQFYPTTLNEIGYEYMLLGNWEKARYYFDLGISFSLKIGDPIFVIMLLNLNELNQYFGKYKEGRKNLKDASIESYKTNYKRLDVLFYWIEFLISIPYPKPIFKFLKKFKIEIEKRKAFYLNELYNVYFSYTYFLNGKEKEALKIAKNIYEDTRKKNLKKEEYLICKLYYLILKDEKYLERAVEISEEIGIVQYKIESLILKFENQINVGIFASSIELIKKIDKLLKKTPFYNLCWRYYFLCSKYFKENGDLKEAKKRLKKAMFYYNEIIKNLPSENIKNIFENQRIAIELKNFKL